MAYSYSEAPKHYNLHNVKQCKIILHEYYVIIAYFLHILLITRDPRSTLPNLCLKIKLNLQILCSISKTNGNGMINGEKEEKQCSLIKEMPLFIFNKKIPK